ncbi:hypothetical protein ACIBCN_23595 [Nocardia sp. NPDC051052]|uniref:hypothetical protein n=1 Tax=Nocardia sp. NPDC051052 TaxID=3364322 RepID=UPI003799E724
MGFVEGAAQWCANKTGDLARRRAAIPCGSICPSENVIPAIDAVYGLMDRAVPDSGECLRAGAQR